MNHWYMLTLVGEDSPGIVADVTHALFEGGCNLGEASMIRLGGNFTIMLMVQTRLSRIELDELVRPAADARHLLVHVDSIEGRLHQHAEPDVQITVYGADRAGIVAQVTGVLAAAGLNILDLDSAVGGSSDKPIYIMSIEGQAAQGIEALEQALEPVREGGIEVSVTPIDTMVG
ncbi:MAG: ACT domain-containing protein [Chromatiales bacterium]|jgi:glycine cleavage system transcriptional repressor|nr:ACT domain-containing protein [Chromatiales bacterium]MDX9767096.1 ACT domain-containing protein [Ectothiorhodospiraceae bacterium]